VPRAATWDAVCQIWSRHRPTRSIDQAGSSGVGLSIQNNVVIHWSIESTTAPNSSPSCLA